jgi:hypothetical protein
MPTEAALAAVTARLDEITAALRLMIATQRTHGEMLAKIFEAACPGEDGGQLEEAMRRIAGALTEQTAVLERVETELSGLGEEVEAGVVRGLAQALGVDGQQPTGDDSAGGQGGREGEGGQQIGDGIPLPGSAGC